MTGIIDPMVNDELAVMLIVTASPCALAEVIALRSSASVLTLLMMRGSAKAPPAHESSDKATTKRVNDLRIRFLLLPSKDVGRLLGFPQPKSVTNG
ncbi:MAG: hypothetical protein LLG01_16340 [Planctomycetaceae bacterium]|nr:hypothetical protein [Planctomycetaceae bacterium]